MRLASVLLGLLAGCGRIGFTDTTGDSSTATIGDTSVADGAEISGLVVWFQFDNDNGTTFTDSISGLQGTCAPPSCPVVTTTNAHRGSAYVFDGVDDCITIPSAPQLMLGSVTLAIWSNQASSAVMTGLSKGLGINNTSWRISTIMSDGVQFAYNAGNNDVGVPTTSFTLTPGTYQHVAVTFDPTVGIEVFVDGTVVSFAGATGALAYDTNTAAIGCLSHMVLSDFFIGALDEIQIYDRALTHAQITQLAKQ